uniref:Uncharacterized protein n=1 Tax=Rhizophora mucronata TaxID=61149 RepID=A0A2P2R4C8_RHIMU
MPLVHKGRPSLARNTVLRTHLVVGGGH